MTTTLFMVIAFFIAFFFGPPWLKKFLIAGLIVVSLACVLIVALNAFVAIF